MTATTSTSSATLLRPQTISHTPRVLLYEPKRSRAKKLREMLTKLGYCCHHASSPVEMIECFVVSLSRMSPYDLFLFDSLEVGSIGFQLREMMRGIESEALIFV